MKQLLRLCRKFRRSFILIALALLVSGGLISCSSKPTAKIDFSVLLNGTSCVVSVPMVGTPDGITNDSQVQGYFHEFKSTDWGINLPCNWGDFEVKILDGFKSLGSPPQESSFFRKEQPTVLIEWEDIASDGEEEHEVTMVFPLFSAQQNQPGYSQVFSDDQTSVTKYRFSITLPTGSEASFVSAVES